MAQEAATQTAPDTTSSPPPGIPALPSLNPTDSPYQPLTLPEVKAPTQHPLPDSDPNQNLGAINKGGAIAYLADKVLRGAVQGYDAHQAQKAQQANKKLSALDTLDQQVSSQFTSALNDVLTSKTGPDGKPVTRVQVVGDPARKIPPDPSLANDPEIAKVRNLYNQGQAVHGATLSALESYLPHLQQDGKGKKSGKGDQDNQLAIYYNAAKQLGWRGGYMGMTDQQAAAGRQQRETAGITSQTGVVSAQTGSTNADTDAAKAQINNKLTHAVASGAPQEEIDKLIKQRDELLPTPKFPLAGLKRTGQDKDGKWEEWQVDEQGNEIKDTRRPLSTAGLNPSEPKVGSFGDFMVAAYGPKPTPKQYIEGQKAWAGSKAGTTIGTHTVLVTQGDKQVPFTFTTTSSKSFGGGGAGTAPDVRADGTQTTSPTSTPSSTSTSVTPYTTTPSHPSGAPKSATGGHSPIQSGEAIGYKDSPEYKGFVKQAIDTQKEYNGAYTNLSMMVKTAAAAKKGDGAAQVGIISAYLKSVVGGQGTGVRITKAEWDAATGTRPFLKGIEAKFSPDGYMTGAAIAPSQVDQMIQEVFAKTKSLKETTKAAKQRMLDAQQDQIPENLRPKPSTSSPSGPPQSIIDSTGEDKYMHGPNGEVYQKKNGKAVPVTQ